MRKFVVGLGVLLIFLAAGVFFYFSFRTIDVKIESAGIQKAPVLLNKKALNWWLKKIGYSKALTQIRLVGEDLPVKISSVIAVFTDQVQPDYQVMGGKEIASSANLEYDQAKKELTMTVEVKREEGESDAVYLRSLEYTLLDDLYKIKYPLRGDEEAEKIWRDDFSKNKFYLRFLIFNPKLSLAVVRTAYAITCGGSFHCGTNELRCGSSTGPTCTIGGDPCYINGVSGYTCGSYCADCDGGHDCEADSTCHSNVNTCKLGNSAGCECTGENSCYTKTCTGCGNYGSCYLVSGSCVKSGGDSCGNACWDYCNKSEECTDDSNHCSGTTYTGACNVTCNGTKTCCTPVQGTISWSPAACSAPFCGQTQTGTCVGASCGGNCNGASLSQTCASTDATAPGQVPISSPSGSSGSPTIVSTEVTLQWSNSEANHNYTDSYQYRIYNATNSTWVVGDGNSGITAGTASATTKSFTGTTAKTYYWQVRAVNSTCSTYTAGTTYGAWSAASYFKIDSVPQIVSLAIQNSAGTAVAAETGNRNQICQTEFLNSTSPRKVTFQLTMSDADGCADINSATLNWNGNVYNLALNGCVGTTTVDYTGVNDSGTYAINGSVSDKEGLTSGLVSTGRNWKVWDCQIPVSGTLYDGSSGQACNTTGFTTAVDNALGFSSLIYHDESSGGDVTMATSLPAAYGPTSVIWGKDYLPLFNGGSATTNINGDLAGTGRMTRLINLDTGVTTCPMTTDIGLSGYFSAYDTNHNAQIDFSFIRDQENWFQVSGGGVKAKNEIMSGVPVTMDSSSRALSIFGVNADNGLISFTSFSNTNGNNDANDYGSPNNWWVDRNTNDSTVYNYQEFYNDFYVKKGIGVTVTDWAGKPSDGVYFVEGDLLIDSDFTLASGKSMMVIVKGKLSIDSSVNRLDGIYVADGGIDALGTSPEQLVINGSLYSRGKIRLARSYTEKSMNNTSPTVKVNYDPALIFNLPGIVMREMSGWNEE